MGDSVFELTYISAAAAPFSMADLRELLARSRRNNARLGITGMLIHEGGSFLQVLEGGERDVLALFEKIAQDPRHGRVLRLFGGKRPARSFGAWTMGFVETDGALASLPGFNDFLRSGFARTAFTPGLETRVRDLALQFRMGRWHQGEDPDQ